MRPLKHKIDRASLETMYKSFVLPVMEYAVAVLDGSYDTDILKLEGIHVNGIRLVTGAKARSNISKLYDETSWLSIMDRRDNTMLTMLFKIKNRMTPDYLYELLPPENHEHVRYNLRNNKNISVPFTRLESFKRSFFPYSIRLWNALPDKKRSLVTVSEFKSSLHQNDKEVNVLYYYGERWAQIHHSRLRIGCSMLKADLYYKLHVIDSPTCRCGHPVENAEHFFLHCPLYNNIRVNLSTIISRLSRLTIKTILFGDTSLDIDTNKIIFDVVHSYMRDSQRFD